MRPYQTYQVLEDIRRSYGCPLYRKGVRLSPKDNQTTLDVYQQWLMLMVDIGYLHPDTLRRDALRLWQDIVKGDVLELNNAFSECLHLVRVQSTKGFKALCSHISTHLYNIVKTDIAQLLEGNVFAAARLTQAFAYTSRLSLQDIDLTQQLLDDYLRIEEEIPTDFNSSLCNALNNIIKSWFSPFDPESIYPQHGPGGVATRGRCSLEDKYKDLTTDKQIAYSFGKSQWWIVDKLREAPSLGRIYRQSDVVVRKNIKPLSRISQTIFVAKSYKTFRTISMEPATLQFFQQGVRKEIQSQIASHDYLKTVIDLEDQGKNRALAQEGSIERNYATIDLSAASDSVSYALVKKLFRGTWLLRYLVTLRSPETLLPDGRTVKLKKFAPMGSSLCFPVETIVFASICELVTRSHHVAGDYSVYGDDIIVPTQCAEGVINILSLLGFRVNREKSFYQGTCWFRESCGGEYFDGHDATPIKVSRKYASLENDVRIGKLIALANAAYNRGYRNLRYFFVHKLREDGVIPHFSPRALLSDNYTNYHTKTRWNNQLQLREARCHTATPAFGEGDLLLLFQNEAIRYHHWFVSTAGRREVPGQYRIHRGEILFCEGFQSMIARPRMEMKFSWKEVPESLISSEGTTD